MSIRRNTIYNIAGLVIPLVVLLATVPIYLTVIGEARYGVLAIVWLLLGYFGIFDLGLGRATAQRIAAMRDRSVEERASVFWTALAMNAVFGVVGGLAIWPIAGFFFGNVFKIDQVFRPEIAATVPWLVLAVPLATVSGVFSGALQGRERFLATNVISVIGTVCFQVFPLMVAVVWSNRLEYLVPAALMAQLLKMCLLFIQCRKSVFGYTWLVFDRSEAGRLLKFGGWVTVTSFIGPMMVILDRLVIGAVSGGVAVTRYTIPFQLAERTTILASATTSALFPRFAAVSEAESRVLANQAAMFLVLVITPLVIIAVFLVEPFLALWLGGNYVKVSAQVGQVIIVGFWFNSFARIPYALLLARGRPNIVAICHLGELVPYFVLLYFALSVFGLVGAACVFSIRTLVDFLLLSGFAELFGELFHLTLIPAIFCVTAVVLAWSLHWGSAAWILSAVSMSFLSLIWGWLHTSKELRALILERITMRRFASR